MHYDTQEHRTEENSQRNSVGYNARYDSSAAYDGADFLTSIGTGVGNFTYTPNEDNQVASALVAGTNYTNAFDHDGNPTTLLNYGTLVYDVFNRVTQAGGFFTAGYRPDDLRAWKKTTSTGVTTYYLYDGDTLFEEVDSSGHLVNTYGYGAAGLLQRFNNGLPAHYAYSFDPSGNVVARHTHNPFANPGEFTMAYNAQGVQLACISANSGLEFTSQKVLLSQRTRSST